MGSKVLIYQPVVELDDVVHQRTRLGVLATLVEVRRADFTALRDGLGLTDGNLSRHLRVLEDAGLVIVEKGYDKRRPRTWIAVTPKGAKAFAREVAILRTLVESVDNPVARKNVTNKGKARQTPGRALWRPQVTG